MKLKNVRTKLSFIFVVLMVSLTLFCVNINSAKADESSLLLNTLETSHGELSPSFSSNQKAYELKLGEYDVSFTLTATANENIKISGLGKYEVDAGQSQVILITLSNDSSEETTYTITATRDQITTANHSSKLSKLEIEGYETDLEPEFHPLEGIYNVDILPNEIDLNIKTETFDKDAKVTIEGNKYIKDNSGIVKIIVTASNEAPTTYTINYKKIELNSKNSDKLQLVEGVSTTFDFEANEQEFIAPTLGIYKIELWGASGSTHTSLAGKGAYTSGKIDLEAGQKLYFYVGQSLSSASATFNGGGSCGSYCTSGGGATDVRISNGDWNDSSSLSSRIMVAAGGGGYNSYTSGYKGGYAGGLTGANGAGNQQPTGGTQTAGGKSYSNLDNKNGKFGLGGTGENYGGGGGGGYYGGAGGANSSTGNGGAGGSSYISGHQGSVAITSQTDPTPKAECETGTENIECSYHYSNMIFTDTIMKSGNEEMPTHDETNVMTGNLGNGYAKITSFVVLSKDNYLKKLSSNYGKLNQEFNPLIEEYNLNLGMYDTHFTLSGELSDEKSSVTGLGRYAVEPGQTKEIIISVMSESGDIRTYKVNVTREELLEGIHSSKLSKLEIEGYEAQLNPEFQPLEETYNVEILSSEIDLNIKTETFDSEAKVKIQGNKYMKNDSGQITITVTESNVAQTVYTINYRKIELDSKYEFSYKGNYQKFIVPATGIYKIQLWGAQGGAGLKDLSTLERGGYGGYTSGNIRLNKGKILYVFVGGKGHDGGDEIKYIGGNSGYNGGGKGGDDSSYAGDSHPDPGGGSGGATDIRLDINETGDWDNFDSLKSRIMVAAGGGGGAYNREGYSGGKSTFDTNVYKFGIGENGLVFTGGSGAGGGGYYGGSSGKSDSAAGYGGTSYISGHEGSNSIDKESTEEKITHTGNSIHYSELYFTDTKMIDGDGYSWTTKKGDKVVNQPTYNGEESQVGNEGDGYAKITPENILSKDNYLSSLSSSYGTLSPTFDPTIEEYNLSLDMYDMHFTLTGELSDEKASVTGLEKYDIEFGETKQVTISVTSESGDIRTYTVNATRKELPEGTHSSKLSKLEIERYETDLNPEFHPLEETYNVEILSNEIDLNITTGTFDDEAKVTIEGNRYIQEDSGQVIITVTEPHSETTIYTINYKKIEMEEEYTFKYKNEYQTFIAPFAAKYKIELWGAQGGFGRYYWSSTRNGGKGGYTSGIISLAQNQTLYIFTGGQGEEGGLVENYKGGTGGYNGGGTAGNDSNDAQDPAGGGGGATDVRLFVSEDGAWDNFDSLKSRIMIAAGGSGGSYTKAGYAGGRSTVDSHIYKFGLGGSSSDNRTPLGGGGGGYYGGSPDYGGVSYISGHEGSNAVTKESTEENIEYTGDSIHYSEMYFTDTQMIDGDGYSWTTKKGTEVVNMPTHDGTDVMTGNEGDGYARITPEKLLSRDNYLIYLGTDKGKLSPEFNPLTEEYELELEVDETEIEISARPSDDTAKIEGLGKQKVPGGETTFEITVTSESGEIRIYKIKTKREKSSESKARDITITGLMPSVCEGYEGYCEIDPKEFDEDTTTYYMTVPSGIRDLEFTVDKKHEYEEVIGDGVTRLNGGDNVITIEVTSEDGQHRTVYRYEITRDMTGNNYIDNLEVVEPSIDIGFNYLITEYAFKVENSVTEIKLKVELDDEKARYEIKGDKDLQVGNNIVEIEVTAENGEVRSYILTVYRMSNGNALLDKLEVRNNEEIYTLSPEFEDIQTKYTLTVPNEIERVQIDVVAQAGTTNVTMEGTTKLQEIINKEKELRTGINEVKVLTTAEDGSTETYTIMITREKSSNNYLSELSAEEGEFNEPFEKEEGNYTIQVNPYVKKLTLSYTPEKETSKVRVIGNGNFKIGENVVRLIVTAENGEEREYIIVVTKEGSDINYLKSLEVSEGELSPGFTREGEEYEVRLGNEVESIIVEGEKEDELSSVIGLGKYTLASGENEIQVVVTSETGKQRTYKIKVYREYNSDALLSNIVVNKGELTPEFSSEEKEYTVNLGETEEEIQITGYARSKTTQVIGNGKYKLNYGENRIILRTKAEDGVTEEEYVIRVIRDEGDNANLSFLLLKEGIIEPKFDPMRLEYTAKVPNEVRELNVIAEPEKKTSEVNITGTEIGENNEAEINIIVTAENGEEKTYKIKVTKEEESENSLDLKTLDVTSCNIVYEKGKQYYECEVEYEVEKVQVNASAEDETNEVTGIGEYNLKQGKNVIEIRVKNTKGQEKDYQVVVTRKESTETRLKKIEVKNHTLNEAFNPDKEEYSITTKEENLEIIIEKMHEEESIEIQGNEGLKLGQNEIKIIVTSADKNHTRTYTIKVTKEESENNYLKSLEIEGEKITPEFKKGIQEYRLTVENEVNSVIIKAEAESMYAQVTGRGMRSLVKGENELIVGVTSEKGETREYKIIVTRLGSRNNNLRNLSVKDHEITPEFTSERTEYTLEVEYEEESIEIIAETEEENARIDGDGIRELKQGKNNIEVVVTAEHGEVKTYKIVVTRKDPVTSLLKNIEVKNYYLDKAFESNTLEYTVVVDNEVTELELIISKLDPGSTYVVEGNKDFEVGLNEVKIISTSSNGIDKTTYKLLVNRQSYSNTYLRSLTVSEGKLSPEFKKEELRYEVEVGNEVERITIQAAAEIITSEVIGTGEKELQVGENTYKIVVRSKGGITRTYTVVVTRKESNNTRIRSITSNVGTLKQLDEGSYELTVPEDVTKVTKYNFTVITEDAHATVEKQEELEITEGENRYIIKVTSADKSEEKTYIIYVKHELSNDSRIKVLETSIGELSPTFDKDIYKYTLSVFDTDEEVELTVELNDERSKLINENLVYELKETETEIRLTVQAEDGSTSVYEITVKKDKTREKTLKDVQITGIEEVCESCEIPEYEETIYEYEITVPYEVKEIGFNIEKKHEGQKVKVYKEGIEVEKYTLEVGINNYKIEVTNSLGEKIEYIYKITRLENTNNYLKSLKLISPEKEIEGFEREKTEYSVQIPYEYENIEIEAIAEDEENAKVDIKGTTYLLEGNNDVKITVTAQNKEKREYILHVLRTPYVNNLIKTLTVTSGDIYTLTPKFTPGITDYTLTVPSVITKIDIDALPDKETTRIEGDGERELKIGVNEIEIKAISEEGIERIYRIRITRESSKNVYLKTLEVRNGIMEEEFKKEKTIYTVDIANTEEILDLVAEPEDENAIVEIIGNKELMYGENIVKIKVTSSDLSASKTYVLTVNKEGDPNNNLLELYVDKERIEGFEEDKLEYSMTVENEKDSVVIDAKTQSKYATVRGLGMHSLKEGENEIEVVVTSQKGIEKVYKIKIYRKHNNYLRDIITDRGKIRPEFRRDVYEYELEVENEIKDITIIGQAEDENAVVEGNGKYTLEVGETTIKIGVTNQEEKREYTLKVTRKGSDNTYLKYLTVAEGVIEPEFERDKEEYTVYVPDDKKKITLDYEPEDETSKVEEIGNEETEEKENDIIIRVTSTSKKTREYHLHVIREDAAIFSNRLLDITVDKGTLSPRFDPDKSEYIVTVSGEEESIKISVVRESVQSTVEGAGTHKLELGRNEIQVKVTSKDKKTRIYTIIVYRELSSDARLKELEFNEGSLSPAFNKNVYKYTLYAEGENEFATIKKIETQEKLATYEIKGETRIETGNEIEIEVTSPDKKTKKTYIIEIEKVKSSNAYLRDLRSNVGEIKPGFEKEIKTYEIEVGEEVNSIIISATAESKTATVIGDGLYELEKGENYVNIVVTAENGTKNVYSIKIIRKKSDKNRLLELRVRGYELDKEFDPEETEYSLEVENEEERVIIDARAEELASITGIGEVELKEGLNEVKVVVTSESGEIRTYTIRITRKKLYSTKIMHLEVEEGKLSPEFNKDIKEYEVLVPNEVEKLTMHVTLEEESARYREEGNENFIVGRNEVKIVVTSENGEEETYIIRVIRQAASNNYLSNIEVDKGELNPKFRKDIMIYEVELPHEEEEITVSATPEVGSTIVKGEGTYELTPGENEIVLEAQSETGIIRVYKIKVIRKKDTNNYLSNLSVSTGELNPEFEREIEEYEVRVEDGTKEIEIYATAESEEAEVTGEGVYKVEVGEREILVTVISESGEIRTYTVKVIRQASSNKNILDIVPSEGQLEPAFDNSRDNYELRIGKEVDIVDFEVTLESEEATVRGNKNVLIDENEKEVVIEVEAEDKSIREVRIRVIKERGVTEIKVKETQITIVEGEEYKIEATVLPEEATNKEIEYIKEEDGIVDVTEEGVITGKNKGTTVIKVRSKENPEIERKIVVNVVLGKISSKIYEVSEKEEGKIVIGAEEGETLKEFLGKLDNEESTIKFYSKEGDEIEDYEEVVKTGIKIKLVIKEKEYDNAVIIVRGDINEDGKINTNDITVLSDHILLKSSITGYIKYAADIIIDDKLDVNDKSMINNYILLKINSLNNIQSGQ